ncbi:MAG: Na+/H+ antiporter subunit C [Ignavibacteria bacterium]|nr:Na+/H+ antiporter subunit C [Ignavibacteria bacterium]
MDFLLVLIIGLLYTAGLYLLMRKSFVKVIIGLILLGHAANLLIFLVGRITRGKPAFVDLNGLITEPFADPLPQALILTAIVIGFGVQAFAIVLFKRAYQSINSDDLDDMNSTDNMDQ